MSSFHILSRIVLIGPDEHHVVVSAIPSDDGKTEVRMATLPTLDQRGDVGYRAAIAPVVAANLRARNKPMKGERCGARTRRGTPCQCKAMRNGRCKFHGGLSTGPKSQAGKEVAIANLTRRHRGQRP